MKFATVCSGIGAPEQAWHSLGWRCAFQSEIEKFPSAVLRHHWPDVPNHGDLLTHKEWPDYAIDLICAGCPCQSFSVAGLRKGLADPRGNLTLAFLGVVARYAPRWVVYENVPGILSDGDNAFGTFLSGLAELGYGTAMRVLDAQYWGLAQRRKRVFVVGYLGDWRPAAAVLFERESLCWNPAPSREAWQGTAPSLAARTRSGGGLGTDAECDGALIANPLRGQANHSHRADSDNLICGTLSGSGAGAQRAAGQANEADFCIPICATITKNYATHYGRSAGNNGGVAENQLIAHALKAEGHDASEDGTGRGVPLVAMANNAKGGSGRLDAESETLLHTRYGVRRLTPRECERLQGFPDDYTLVKYRKRPAKDGPRYKALGNSMAVPVVRWLGERIEMVEQLQRQLA